MSHPPLHQRRDELPPSRADCTVVFSDCRETQRDLIQRLLDVGGSTFVAAPDPRSLWSLMEGFGSCRVACMRTASVGEIPVLRAIRAAEEVFGWPVLVIAVFRQEAHKQTFDASIRLLFAPGTLPSLSMTLPRHPDAAAPRTNPGPWS